MRTVVDREKRKERGGGLSPGGLVAGGSSRSRCVTKLGGWEKQGKEVSGAPSTWT